MLVKQQNNLFRHTGLVNIAMDHRHTPVVCVLQRSYCGLQQVAIPYKHRIVILVMGICDSFSYCSPFGHYIMLQSPCDIVRITVIERSSEIEVVENSKKTCLFRVPNFWLET